MSLISLDEMLLGLKIYSPNAEIRLRYDGIRQRAEASVISYCNWPIAAVTGQVDYYSGNGYMDIPIRCPYVSSITEVRLDPNGYFGQGANAFGTNSILTAGSDYCLVLDNGNISKCGILRRIGNNNIFFPSDLVFGRIGGLSFVKAPYWQAGQGNIKVTYNYGFSTIPEDIKSAVITLAGILASSNKYGSPLTSESLGAHSVSMQISREPDFGTVRQLLSKYRDTAI